MKVDFATFCHAGDAHRLHAPGQLKKQVESNNFEFDKIIVIYQMCDPLYYAPCPEPLRGGNDILPYTPFPGYHVNISTYEINHIDGMLHKFGIDLDKPQYASQTDKAHTWKNHVVNHLTAINQSNADYIVFADNDCWMVRQPEGKSWIERGIELLRRHDCFIVSPNDGEPERKTRRMSQQMFMARNEEFRYADFNQPGWDRNVNIPGGPMPEYWGMLEGRMELHCRFAGKYRYILPPEYRYWHFNKLTKDGLFETDLSKY